MRIVSAIIAIMAVTFLAVNGAAFGQEQYIKARCHNCGELFRVPIQKVESVVVTCPHCGEKAKVKMPEPRVIAWEQAGKYIGKEKIIEGKVVKTYKHPQSNNVYFNLNPDFKTYGSVAIKSTDIGKFAQDPQTFFQGRKVKITGKIVEHKGKPRIWLTDPSQIEIVEPGK